MSLTDKAELRMRIEDRWQKAAFAKGFDVPNPPRKGGSTETLIGIAIDEALDASGVELIETSRTGW